MIRCATPYVQDDDLIGLCPVDDRVITLPMAADAAVFVAGNQRKALGEIGTRQACHPQFRHETEGALGFILRNKVAERF
jgi:hypothetical protein